MALIVKIRREITRRAGWRIRNQKGCQANSPLIAAMSRAIETDKGTENFLKIYLECGLAVRSCGAPLNRRAAALLRVP